jgi:hypothetical protein
MDFNFYRRLNRVSGSRQLSLAYQPKARAGFTSTKASISCRDRYYYRVTENISYFII